MGALYEDVENFFGDIFAWYGRLVTRFPVMFTLVPLLSCVIFGLGLLNIHYETNIENLYSPTNSDAQKDRQILKSFFDHHHHYHQQQQSSPPPHSKARQGTSFQYESTIQKHIHQGDNSKMLDFRFHQQINYPAYIEIIIFNKKPSNASSSSSSSSSSSPPSGNSTFSCFLPPTNQMTNQSRTFQESEGCDLVAFDREDPSDDEDKTSADELFQSLTEFSNDTWRAIQFLYRSVATHRGPKNPNFHYGSVCARFGDACAVDVFELPDDKTACMFPKNVRSQKMSHLKSSGKKATTVKQKPSTTRSPPPSDFFTSSPTSSSKPAENQTKHFQTQPDSGEIPYLPPLIVSTSAKAAKLRFNLRGETHGQARQRHLRWQDSILDHLKRFRSPVIDIAFVASDSLEIELRDHVGGDTKYFALSVVAMLVSATMAGSGGSLDHVVLAYTGVVAALLAILGAFGLLSLAGASFVNLCSVMPFLVLGIGVDDMLQLLVGWRKTVNEGERLSGTLRSAAVSITITSLTDLLAFCIGATSPFMSVRNFCACSGVGIFLCYVNQLTFFSGCIVLISNPCRRKKTPKSPKEANSSPQREDRRAPTDSTVTTTTIVDLDPCNEVTSAEVDVEREGGKHPPGGTQDCPSNSAETSRFSSGDSSGTASISNSKGACSAGSATADGKPPRKADIMFTTLVKDVLSSVPPGEHHVTDDVILSEPTPMETKDAEIYQLMDCCGALRSCYKQRDEPPAGRSGICELFSRMFVEYYPKILLHWVGKTFTVILYLAYVGVSIHGVANLEEGLNLEALVPPENYYRRHAEIDGKFFPNCGIIVTFFVHQPITYHEFHTQERLQLFLKSVESSEFLAPGSTISWLDEFLDQFHASDKEKHKKRRMDEVEFARRLQKEFFPKHPRFLGDLAFSRRAMTPSYVEASRFYVVCQRTNSSEREKDLMLTMRWLAGNSSLPVKAFSPHFVFYEHYASIVKNALLPVGVTMIGMLFVALVFIPHPIAVTCVVGSMASVVVGMMGFMQLCGLALSAITTMQIILGVGICVSFTVRTNHAFMTATGKSRNERVTAALVKVGASILTGAACSLLSASALYYGSSFIFTSFFKTTAFALLLGVLHSIVFLPVMLSFVGPRRTSKPRLFIPVTPAPSSSQAGGSQNCPLIERDRHPSEESTRSKSSLGSLARRNSGEVAARSPATFSRSYSVDQCRTSDGDFPLRGSRMQKVSFRLEETRMQDIPVSDSSGGGEGCAPKQRSGTRATRAQTNF